MNGIAIPDLWPESIDDAGAVNTPVGILRQQGIIIGKRTGNLITADVRLGTRSAGELSYVFELVAPTLGFRYPLLAIRHPITASYPVWVTTDMATDRRAADVVKPGTKAETAEQFMELVRQHLAAATTQQIVKTLLAQSREFADELG